MWRIFDVDLPVAGISIYLGMKRVLVTFLTLLLVAGPAMAHHASNASGHKGHAEMSSAIHGAGEYDEVAEDGVSDCEEHDRNVCCSFVVVHCETNSARNEVVYALISLSTEPAFFVRDDDTLLRLMPERETPPPRI
ncbi:MAG: hypothetical protein JJ900_03310 [Rhodospirillales bacterium]|nr:hypothetical protein [Rhodospirillales bacterium]MBO6785853.1 hypothetical protein [Rhodospirillales bacterium]